LPGKNCTKSRRFRRRFFASGSALCIVSELDLVDVAYQFSSDNKTQVEQWMQNSQLGPVTDQRAINWLAAETEVWAVVVKPWILVQE
jgi:hypothetical protein